jgi:hypothetical protein
MHGIKQRGLIAAFFVAIFSLAPAQTLGQDLVVGVNVVNPMRASLPEQNVLLSQLKAAVLTHHCAVVL